VGFGADDVALGHLCLRDLWFSPAIERFPILYIKGGAWGSVVVKALRYKSEGPGIDCRCRRGFFRGI
jgi:hypothetical protein